MVRIPALNTAREWQEHHGKLQEFYLLAACRAANISAAEAEARRLPARVVEVLKATVAGSVTGNVGLSNYGQLVGAFLIRSRMSASSIASSATRCACH